MIGTPSPMRLVALVSCLIPHTDVLLIRLIDHILILMMSALPSFYHRTSDSKIHKLENEDRGTDLAVGMMWSNDTACR